MSISSSRKSGWFCQNDSRRPAREHRKSCRSSHNEFAVDIYTYLTSLTTFKQNRISDVNFHLSDSFNFPFKDYCSGSFFAHLSQRLKWAFLIKICMSLSRAVYLSNFFDTIRYNRCEIRYIGWTIYWKIFGVNDQKRPRTVTTHF